MDVFLYLEFYQFAGYRDLKNCMEVQSYISKTNSINNDMNIIKEREKSNES